MATQTGTPTFVQLDYFNLTAGHPGWTIGHHGINLMNPQKYVDALFADGKIARVTNKETGEVFLPEGYDEDKVSGNPEMEGDGVCKCGTSESDHNSVDPPHMFVSQASPDVTELGGLLRIPPHAMTLDQVKAALVAEGDLTVADVKGYGAGFAIKALTALRTPAPEPEPEVDALDEFADLAEFDDDVFTTLPPGTKVKMPNGKTYDADTSSMLDEEVTVITTLAEKRKPDKASIAVYGADDREDVPTAEEAGQALFIGMPGTKDYIFDGHAGAGPSGAERWMECTASLGAARAFLETLTANQQREFAKASQAARQGTTAHTVGEVEARLMLGEITEEERNNTILELSISPPDGEEYDDEMAEYTTEYGDFVKQFHQSGHEVLIEVRVGATVELTTVDSDGDHHIHTIQGSADFAALPLPRKRKKDKRVLTVGDLKYGKGKDVDADENPQGKTYALGVIEMLVERGEDVFDIDRVDIIIIQPRLGGIKSWSTTVDDLLTWRDEVLSPALTEALGGLKGGAKFVPGEVQCQWCPARGGCAALAEARLEEATELFDVIVDSEFKGDTFPETTTLSNDKLAALYEQVTGLTTIAADLKAEMQRRLHRGQEVPGFHLVGYQPKREWKDEAVEALSPETFDEDVLDADTVDKLWQRKMLSPTQALKVLGKDNEATTKVLADLIDVPDQRPIVAPVTSNRKPWAGKPPEQMFADESATEGDE